MKSLSQEEVEKIKRRVRKSITQGVAAPRVRFSGRFRGMYLLQHHVVGVPFFTIFGFVRLGKPKAVS